MDPSSPPSPRLPWDFHPALSEDRLRICARMLANARRDALAMASRELGDDPWSIGCRAFAFGRHRLKRAAASGQYPWLAVLDDSAHFVFFIGGNGRGVPVRFYRGPADEPTGRTLRRQEGEAQQLSLALGEAAAAAGLVFRFAVETGPGGQVERVVFLALRGEEVVECFWPVPLAMPPAAETGTGPGAAAVQLRLIADDGYEGPRRAAASPPPPPLRPALPRRRAGANGPYRPENELP